GHGRLPKSLPIELAAQASATAHRRTAWDGALVCFEANRVHTSSSAHAQPDSYTSRRAGADAFERLSDSQSGNRRTGKPVQAWWHGGGNLRRRGTSKQ